MHYGLKPITGIDSEKYVQTMLSNLENVGTSATPYKRANIKKALIEINKMGISLDQTKFLKDLNKTNPELFD